MDLAAMCVGFPNYKNKNNNIHVIDFEPWRLFPKI